MTTVDMVRQAIREDRWHGYTHFTFKARVTIGLRVVA